MSEIALLAAGLAFFMPLGYGLVALGGLADDRARHAALSVLAALGLATLGYLAAGFAFQFGGIGLLSNQPGYDGLIWEWSALGPTWGAGWGMLGMAGFGMSGPAATPAAYALALANLPWVATAALIPLAGLRGRIPGWASGLVGLLIGAIVYPAAANWIWGGGWLANLGLNLGQGHGFVDLGGSGLVHVLGACAAFAGILVFVPRMERPQRSHSASRAAAAPLPPAHMPALAVLGAGLLLVGNLAWVLANPLFDGRNVELTQMALNSFVAATAGGLLPLFYTWFVAGNPDPLMAARGVAAGSIAGAAAAPFVPAWAALALGAGIGLLVPLVIFLVERVARIADPTAALTVHGLSGAVGLLAVGVLADGRAGQGWNDVGASQYLGVARQGVTGLLAAAGYQPDWPGQLQAQAVGLAALALFGFFATWLVLVPPAMLRHLLIRRPATAPAAAPAPSGFFVTRLVRVPPAMLRRLLIRHPAPAPAAALAAEAAVPLPLQTILPEPCDESEPAPAPEPGNVGPTLG